MDIIEFGIVDIINSLKNIKNKGHLSMPLITFNLFLYNDAYRYTAVCPGVNAVPKPWHITK